MSITAGTRLGAYEIISQLGAGGMGEVYRARDPRLDREVAIKVLPVSFATDADRLARFEQEARATSALNHPNVLTVHDFGTHEGSPYIVAELLEGEELRQQLNNGALPHRKAVDYAQQICAGLAAAHERGITHRDLKPENLFVATDGRLKILDFGLAKLRPQTGQPVGSGVATQRAITDPGVVMGTVGYMSPEQVRGQEADHRADIFSFGVILFEMLTGRRAFQRETMAETMTAILKEEPEEVTEINSKVPLQLERIVRRCLEKKPERRFQTASDLGFAIEALSTPSGSRLDTATSLPAVTASTGKARLLGNARLAWIAATVLLLALLASLPFAIAYLRRAPTSAETIRFSVSAPDGWSHSYSVISPDGRRVAFTCTAQDKRQLWVRPLNALTAQLLPGTEDASFPFWSPNSRSIGFFTSSKLKKVDLSGGLPQPLCDTTAVAGGAWNGEGVIIFGTDSGLFRVSATGGAATALTTIDEARQETGHHWPFFLPDGRHLLFCLRGAQQDRGIYLASLDGGKLQRIASDYSSATYAASAEGGYLLFVRSGALMAQPFDSSKLKLMGEPFGVAELVRYNPGNGRGYFSVSENGVLVFDPSSFNWSSQLVWMDRAGTEVGIAVPPAIFGRFRLSPDGQRIVMAQSDPQSGNTDLWVRELRRGSTPRFTLDPGIDNSPIWSPEGSRIAWYSNRGGSFGIYQKSASGAGQDELLLESNDRIVPYDWSADGRFIVYSRQASNTSWDVWVLPLEGERKPFSLLQSPYFEGGPRLSPDGRWLAYSSNETGRDEVYVTPFPNPSAKLQISTGGGERPQWRRDGRELYYVAANGKLMAVELKGGASPGAGFEAGAPQALFEARLPYASGIAVDFYNVTTDGQRFLVNTLVGEGTAAPLTVVVNWTAEDKR